MHEELLKQRKGERKNERVTHSGIKIRCFAAHPQDVVVVRDDFVVVS